MLSAVGLAETLGVAAVAAVAAALQSAIGAIVLVGTRRRGATTWVPRIAVLTCFGLALAVVVCAVLLLTLNDIRIADVTPV